MLFTVHLEESVVVEKISRGGAQSVMSIKWPLIFVQRMYLYMFNYLSRKLSAYLSVPVLVVVSEKYHTLCKCFILIPLFSAALLLILISGGKLPY